MLVKPVFSGAAPADVAAATVEANTRIDFVATRKGSAFVVEAKATIVSTGSFYDLHINPVAGSTITEARATVEGGAPFEAVNTFGDTWQARVSPVTADTQRVEVYAVVDGSAQSIEFWIGNPVVQPAGVYATVQEGESVDIGHEFEATFGEGLAGDATVDFGLWRMPSTQMSTASYPVSLAGTVRNFEVTSAGDYEIRATYQPSGHTEVTAFSVPGPVATPFESHLSIPIATAFEGDTVRAVGYVDHRHDVTRIWLDIDGVEHAQPLLVGTRSFVLPTLAVGSYAVTLHADLSDTTPDTSASHTVTVTIQAVPVATLLDDATADYTDVAKWQAVIDSPNATPRQQEVASWMAELGEEIDSGFHGTPGTQFAANDRDLYVAEELGKSNPLTFDEWFAKQQNWDDPQEQLQARNLIGEAPTSSLAALLNYWNQPLAFGSMGFALQAGIATELRLIESAVGPGSAVRAFEAYQAWTAQSHFLISFIDFARNGGV